MDFADHYCHSATTEVDRPAEAAFAFMRDGMKQTRWAFGSWDRKRIGDDSYVGTSMFTSKPSYVRLAVDPDAMLVTYFVGPTPDTMTPRNLARVVPGPVVGRSPDTCLVTLITWRTADMPDDRWRLLCLSHKTEMYIIRHLIESGA